jgi:hypothetical protein
LAKNLRFTDTVTIASSGTVSTTVTMENNRVPLAIFMPAAFSGTSVKFEASADGSNFFRVYNAGADYEPTVSASKYVTLNQSIMDSVRYVKLVSTSTETAARTITIISGE